MRIRIYTSIIGVGIALNFILNAILSLHFRQYLVLVVATCILVLYVFICKSKFFLEVENEKKDKYIIVGSVINQAILLLLGMFFSIVFFKQFVWYGFIGCCVLSVGYSICYMPIHESLMKIGKRYCIVYLFFVLIFMVAVIAIFLIVPKDYLMVVIGQGATIYEVFPFIIGGKFIIDILIAFLKLPSIA